MLKIQFLMAQTSFFFRFSYAKFSSGHVICKFDNPAKHFHSNTGKINKLAFLKNKVDAKCSSGHVERLENISQKLFHSKTQSPKNI